MQELVKLESLQQVCPLNVLHFLDVPVQTLNVGSELGALCGRCHP